MWASAPTKSYRQALRRGRCPHRPAPGLEQSSLSSVGADASVRPPVLYRTHGRARGPRPTKCSAVGRDPCVPPHTALLAMCHCEGAPRPWRSREGRHVDRTRHCRGADSRARRRTYSPYKPPSKWQTLPTCHCEAPKGPWQSREGSCDFADGFPTFRPGTARLHPKGTSSRFALRAPRRPAASSQ